MNSWINTYNLLTEQNAHGKALFLLANETGQTEAARVLALVNQIHDIEGHLPHHLNEYRNAIMKRVHERAREVMGNKFQELQ